MEAVVWRCSVKKVFLKISQNSQENTCARVSLLIKFQVWGLYRCFPVNFAKFSGTPFFDSLKAATLLKKRFWHRCFLVNFTKFLRTPFLQNASGGCFCKSLQLYLNKTSSQVFFVNFLKNFRTFFWGAARIF